MSNYTRDREWPAAGDDDDTAKVVANNSMIGPYVGDYPWPSPYVPVVPYQPPVTPGTGTTTHTLILPGVKMDVFIIWAMTPDQPDAPWAVSVWDSESRSANEDGFLEDLARQEETYGARFVRVTKTSVNYDAVVRAFGPADV